MKKWIGIITCFVVTLTSLRADVIAQPEPAQEETTEEEQVEKKQVGKAADDGSQSGSGAGKYIAAAAALAVGVAALVLVSRHHGRSKK